jgi:predicted double-glycine peptidase
VGRGGGERTGKHGRAAPRRAAARRAAARGAASRGTAARGTRVANLVTASFAAALLAAGPGVSALGVARSMRWRARPYLVAPGSGTLPVALLQRGPQDCGPAALATVLAWRGRPVGEGPILRAAHLRTDGVSLAELVRLAAAFELPGAWYAVPRRRLDALPTPFIAHVRAGRRLFGRGAGDRGDGHFVAVCRVVLGFVLLADPARGLVLEREARFSRSWTGRVLLFDPVVAAAGARAPAASQGAARIAAQDAGTRREKAP